MPRGPPLFSIFRVLRVNPPYQPMRQTPLGTGCPGHYGAFPNCKEETEAGMIYARLVLQGGFNVLPSAPLCQRAGDATTSEWPMADFVVPRQLYLPFLLPHSEMLPKL